MVNKNSELHEAIKNTIYDMFDDKIPIDDPAETTEKFIEKLNEYLDA